MVVSCTAQPKPVVAPFGTLDPNNPWRAGRTLVIPHAGGDGLYPENTLVAYAQTMAMGADVIDVDLQLSADAVPVAIHDATVTRTTGAAGSISAMTLSQLQELDAGYAFTRAGSHPFRGKGIAIPSLEEVLARFPDVLLSLDLKNESLAMVEPLCSLLLRYGRTTDVFVGSNGDDVILQFRKRCPTVRTSAVMADVREMRRAMANPETEFRPVPLVNQPPFRRGASTTVSPEGLAFAHRHGIAVLTWVINDESDMRHLVEMGVDGIYTSYPDRLLRLLGRYREPTKS